MSGHWPTLQQEAHNLLIINYMHFSKCRFVYYRFLEMGINRPFRFIEIMGTIIRKIRIKSFL
jgi:hypothetical protein